MGGACEKNPISPHDSLLGCLIQKKGKRIFFLCWFVQFLDGDARDRPHHLRRAGRSPLDQADGIIRFFCQPVAALEPGDIGYGFEDMDRFFEKGQDICRKEFYPVFIEEEGCDLPVVQTTLPQLDDAPGKLLLRAAAQRRVPAVASQEFVEKSKDLFPHPVIQGIVIYPRAECLEHGSGKGQLGKAVTGKPF